SVEIVSPNPLDDHNASYYPRVVTETIVYYAAGIVDCVSIAISSYLWACCWIEGELLAPFIGVIMSLDYQVHFLLDEHVEESYSHRAGGVAAAYAELVSRNDHPSDSFGASVIDRVRGPVKVSIIDIVLPAPVLVGAGGRGVCLRTAR